MPRDQDPQLLGTETLKDIWTHQDRVYAKDAWLETYWTSTKGPHRDAIITALEGLDGFDSVFEAGCNAGPNLRRIHARWPGVDAMGMDIHREAIRYGRAAARAEGWSWAGYVGDLRELGLLGENIADVVLTCYSLAYLDPRDIDTVLAAALACATRALVIAEPMAFDLTEELFIREGVPEYHYAYPERLARLCGPLVTSWVVPVEAPENRVQQVLVVQK
jgi:hypothetical protein